jgi:hypothetical protein
MTERNARVDVSWWEQSELFLRRLSASAGARLRGREDWFIAVIIGGAAVVSAVWLYRIDPNSFLYFGDGVSHLTRARQFVDSRLPGIHNIGTVWLPLPHLLMLPLALIDALFYTGLAAPYLGIPLLVGTTLVLYRIIVRLIGSRPIAILCALLFGLNPNLVYMALTPMTELYLLFFTALGALTLLQWHDGEGERYLIYCAAWIVCASLCRYEAWLLVPFVSLAAFARALNASKAGEPIGRVLLPVSAGMLAWLGVALWLGWNFLEYGDALKFAHWTHTVAARSAPAAVEGRPFEMIRLAGLAMRSVFGSILLIAAAASILRLVRRGLDSRAALVLVFMSLPAVFALAAIFAGYAQIDEWKWNWRYMLTLSLFFSAAAGAGFNEVFGFVKPYAARAAIVLGAFAIPVIQLTMPVTVGVSTYIDAKNGFLDDTQFAKHAGEQLRQSGATGSVALLTGYGQSQRIMMTSGLPLKTFHLIYAANEEEFLKPLWPEEQYVVIGKKTRPESRLLVDYWLKRRDILLARYSIVWEDAYYMILKLNPSRSSYQEQDPARR